MGVIATHRMKLLLLCALLPCAHTLLAAPRALPRLATPARLSTPPRMEVAYGDADGVTDFRPLPPPPAWVGKPVDWAHLAAYPLATAGEFAILAALFRAVDAVVTLPTFLVPPLFLFLSLRSRIFSFVPASRPPRGGYENEPGKRRAPVRAEVKRPSWTPPGFAFPIIWITISLLRAASSTLVWRACGRTLFSAPLLALVLHLCVGDTWNCVTNIEQRLGVSAVGVLAVLASVYTAVAVYYKTTPLAGLLLAPSACWITIASVLTWTIWSINEPRQPLLPREGEGKNAAWRLPLSAMLEK